jgi:glutamate formiminotransferase
MTLIAVPNVSEGRDLSVVAGFSHAVTQSGARVLDVHSDGAHNRSVLTLTGGDAELVAACTALAGLGKTIDLQRHEGVHPRLGGLDVCPFVPHGTTMEEAIALAHRTARSVADETGLPVYLYGRAARRRQTRELPDLRRGGLSGLMEKCDSGLTPDEGPARINPHEGVVCVGARGPLIAFNVWLETVESVAHAIAVEMRSESVRAMGLRIDDRTAQVSMNLIQPERTGIEEAFESVRAAASLRGVDVVATELVGLVERRFWPRPDATVARLLKEPGHCLEDRLASG